MRVLLITGSFPPMKCGVGDYSYSLAKALAADPEIRVGVLTSFFDENKGEVEGVEVFPIINSWGFADTLKVIKVIWYWMPDIVHIQYPTQGYGNRLLPFMLPIISFLMGKHIVQTWHEGYSRRNAPKLFFKAIIPGGLVVVRPQFRANLHPMLHWALWNKKFVYIRNASAISRSPMGDQEKVILKEQYLKGQKRLIVFFGFVYPHKGVELLFDIADPVSDHIVIAGEFGKDVSFHQKIMQLSSSAPWVGKVTITGFLASDDVAALLAVADAVILPFRVGGGEWNTSIHSAVLQGTFVITTSITKNGYNEKVNVYYAKVDDVQEMKSALDAHAGRRRKYSVEIDKDEWLQISTEHRLLYKAILAR